MFTNAVYQGTVSFVSKAKELRNNTDFFQKTCQVMFASLRLVIDRYPAAKYLSKFAVTLDTANIHDFYHIFVLPRDLFFPVKVDRLDPQQLADALIEEMDSQCPITQQALVTDSTVAGEDEEESQDFATRKKSLAHECVRNVLLKMAANDDASTSVEDVKKKLYRELVPFNSLYGCVFDPLFTLDGIDVTLASRSWSGLFQDCLWKVVDFGSVGLYLNEWGILDTAKLGLQFGSVRGLQWVADQKLLSWVYGLVCTGYILQLLGAVRELGGGGLSAGEKRGAQLRLISSCSEVLYQGSNFLNSSGRVAIPTTVVLSLGIIAKSIGLLGLIYQPEREITLN